MTKVHSSFRALLRSCTAILLGVASIALAQDFTDKKINSVQVRYAGAKTVDEARIRNLMSVKAGQKFSAEKLDDDIRSLVNSGLVDDVTMSGEEQGSGMNLIVKVETRPALAGVGFAGNAKFSDGKLAKQTELNPGLPINDVAIYEARKKIEEYYQGYGYSDVNVSYRLQKTNRTGFSDVIFVIQEGDAIVVEDIKFNGNNAFSDADLRREMETKKKDILSFITKSGRIEAGALEGDEDRIIDFYRNKGYLKAQTSGFKRMMREEGGSESRLFSSKGKDKIELEMDVYEGVQYSINQVSFANGMKVFAPEDLMPVMTLNDGDTFSSSKMRADIRTIRSYYGSRGYADANVDPDIQYASGNTVNIVYSVSEGRPYKVGRVTIEGNNKTKDKVIRREIPLKPGDNFNTVDVETTRKRLEGLNYFSNVVTEGAPSDQDGYRDINVLVEEKQTGQLSFGLGFSSIDNIVGYVTVEETNFDITNPWKFRGGGQRMSLNLRLGTETQDFSLSLTEPWFLGRRLSLGTEIFYLGAQNLSDYYDQRNVGAAISLRKPLGNRSYLNASLRYEKIRVDVDDDVPSDSLFQDVGGRFTRPALSLSYVYDSRNALQTPRSGHKLEAGATTILEALGGDSDSFILEFAAQKYWNLWYDSILEIAGEMNLVETSDGPTPIYDRQFLGGARNLRGFEYRDIGPRDPATEGVIGGNTAAYVTVEVTFPLISSVRGAVFTDAGFVNLDSYDFDASDYQSDAGLGLRMNLPFGPIALDYAIPVRSPDSDADKGGQFNFYVDYAF
ncbi:outer membrane protein assembly factor BamA [Rubritalea sp.]|uniref:outer membrane protein assembly factor BamA n=1 Tax=Rubritalea sp. TaxID=2109375 RepID=UPI003EF346A8